MPSKRTKHLWDALTDAIKEKRAHASSTRIRAVAGLASSEKNILQLRVDTIDRELASLNQAARAKPELASLIKALSTDHLEERKRFAQDIDDLAKLIEEAERQDESIGNT